jgi:hypothetical protein
MYVIGIISVEFSKIIKVTMPLSRKRKQHLRRINPLAAQAKKRQKLEREAVSFESEYRTEELQQAASGSLKITALFQRQRELNQQQEDSEASEARTVPPWVKFHAKTLKHQQKNKTRVSRQRKTWSDCLTWRQNKRKYDLYRQSVGYGLGEWKKLTSHQKMYLPGDDR